MTTESSDKSSDDVVVGEELASYEEDDEFS